ncbi:MAG: hypothetical protein PHC54_02485 [Candidatus Omnitrophica bacterium]|nr:hypothetical protein [Candidatus Omnitrophota bacterium]MDD5592260.1 hypothetical protein [Candidatus Omnitrophota bacterium]
MDKKTKLSNRQLLTVSHIITSPTLEEARRKAKVSKGTLYAWLKEEAFKVELKRQRDEVIKEALSRLKSAISQAVEKLVKLLDNEKPDLRRLVCRDILNYALKSIELEDIETRIANLEEKTKLARKFHR